MINYEKAHQAFEEYLSNYDLGDSKINHKILHTYSVVKLSEYIARDLNLDDENIELAKVIALLHDIGRFEQAKKFNDFVDYRTMDHADYGAKILFEDGIIRKFVEEDKYDNIILKSIKNHNNYVLEDELTGDELLHSKIIRDADKTDSFRVKAVDDVKDMSNIDESIMVTQEITDEIFNDFMSNKTIVSNKRKTFADMWVSYIAFIFDYNFNSGLKYIKENNYINVLVDRFKFENKETINKMEKIRECALEYIDDKINNNNNNS